MKCSNCGCDLRQERYIFRYKKGWVCENCYFRKLGCTDIMSAIPVSSIRGEEILEELKK